ncbi:MAG: beta-lactamase family protein [Planctomycetes bacterium]|nr:beta-lactamase family protein [Planctomycetota bacterium]
MTRSTRLASPSSFALTLGLVASSSGLLSGQAPAEPVGRTTAAEVRVRGLLERRRELHGFPGACAAWVGRDGICHAVAVGLFDREAKRPMTTSALLLSGSIGKTYVATVALQLVQEQRLGLDHPVAKYLGDRPFFARLPNAAQLTIRSLLNHTSGLPRYVFAPAFLRVVASQPDKVWKPEELLAHVLDAKPRFAVGKGWSYADTNYIVLGMVIEKVTGAPFYKELRTRVLERFGLRDTVPSDRRRIAGLVPGYSGSGKAFGVDEKTLDATGAMVFNPQFEWCGGGLACTTADLARWARIYGRADHWPKALRAEVFRGVAAELGPEAKYGLGVIVRPTRHGIALGHSGFMPGYVSEMRYYPELDLAVAIQCNTDRRKQLGMPLSRYLDDIVDSVGASRTGRDGTSGR